MSWPIDIVRSFHNSFRSDLLQIDSSAYIIARNGGDLDSVFDRLTIVAEILDYHAKGEEVAVFPAVEKLAPLVAQAYFLDHRELDTMVDGLMVMRKNPDALKVARATAILQSHLRIHLDKEDVHLYPILRDRTSESEQASIVGLMSSKVPSDKISFMVEWLFPLLGLEDKIVVAEGWMKLMPPKFFAGLKPLIKKVTAKDWSNLVSRIPDLEEK